MFDFTKYADQVANADLDRVDRDFIEEGSHIIRITATECVKSANTSNDLVILEGEVVSSTTLDGGTLIKHIWSLSGVDGWRVNRNLGQLKALVLATLPEGVTIDGDVVSRAIQGGTESVVTAAHIRVDVRKKRSKNDKEYLSYSFMRAPERLDESTHEDTPIGDAESAAAWSQSLNN